MIKNISPIIKFFDFNHYSFMFFFCWFIVLSGVSLLWSKSDHHMQKAGKDRRKKLATPGWYMAVLRSKGTIHPRIFFVAMRQVDPSTILLNLKSLALTSFSHIHCANIFNTVSLNKDCGLGIAFGSNKGKQILLIFVCLSESLFHLNFWRILSQGTEL